MASARPDGRPVRCRLYSCHRVAVLRKAIGEALAKPEIRAKLEAEGRTVAQPNDNQAQANQLFDQYMGRVSQLIRNVGRKTAA